MKRRLPRFGIFGLLLAAAGCGDNFPRIVNTEMALLNELADSMAKVVDEDTATDFQEIYAEKLKDAQETLLKRKERYLKNVEEDAQIFGSAMKEVLGNTPPESRPEGLEELRKAISDKKGAVEQELDTLGGQIRDLTQTKGNTTQLMSKQNLLQTTKSK